jgi:hypothetical protein
MKRASSARPPERDSIWATALQATAGVARQGGASEADVLRALTDALRRLKMSGTVFLYREDEQLEVRSVAISPSLTTSMAQLTGIPVLGYTFDSSRVELLTQALQTRQAVFSPSQKDIVHQITPDEARDFAPAFAEMVGDGPVIAAPLLSGDRPLGVLTVTAPWMSPDDRPMVAALADHVAIALDHIEAQAEMRRALERERMRNLRPGIGRRTSLTKCSSEVELGSAAQAPTPDGCCSSMKQAGCRGRRCWSACPMSRVSDRARRGPAWFGGCSKTGHRSSSMTMPQTRRPCRALSKPESTPISGFR